MIFPLMFHLWKVVVILISQVSDQSSANLETDDNEASSIPAIIHSVIFKCIRNLKELHYQEVLALANKKIKKEANVQVKLERELSNPVDTTAITIMCTCNVN